MKPLNVRIIMYFATVARILRTLELKEDDAEELDQMLEALTQELMLLPKKALSKEDK